MEARSKIRFDNNLQDVQQKTRQCTLDAENVALLAECTHYNCGRRLFSGVPWKLLKSRAGCSWVLPGCILAAGSCSFKVGTTVLLYGRSCNNSVALRADVRNTHLLGLEIFCDIFQQPHTWNRAALKSDVVQQCTWVQECCYSTEELRNAFTSKNPLMHSARLLSSTATLSFKNSAREPTWPRNGRGLWPYIPLI